MAAKLETREVSFCSTVDFSLSSAHYYPSLLVSQRVRDGERKGVLTRPLMRSGELHVLMRRPKGPPPPPTSVSLKAIVE